jgi:hypothetical protein
MAYKGLTQCLALPCLRVMSLLLWWSYLSVLCPPALWTSFSQYFHELPRSWQTSDVMPTFCASQDFWIMSLCFSSKMLVIADNWRNMVRFSFLVNILYSCNNTSIVKSNDIRCWFSWSLRVWSCSVPWRYISNPSYTSLFQGSWIYSCRWFAYILHFTRDIQKCFYIWTKIFVAHDLWNISVYVFLCLLRQRSFHRRQYYATPAALDTSWATYRVQAGVTVL